MFKVLELFGGIIATSKALDNIGLEHETTYIDYDKKVVEVKNALWGTNDDTMNVEWLNTTVKYDLLIAGFPCQPFSMAGKGLGFDDSRGKLYKEVLRIIKNTNPNFIILENVKAITFKKHKWIITEIENELREMGYFVNTQIINAKNYLPQNRERVFIMASIYPINKVEDKTHDMVLGDFLESNVDESLYYDDVKLGKIYDWHAQENCLLKIKNKNDKYIKTITTRTQPGTSSQQLICDSNFINLMGIVFKTSDLIKRDGKKGYWFKLSDGSFRKIGYREEQKNWLLPISRNYTNNIINDSKGMLSTLTTSPKKIIDSLIPLRIRSITPREAWRLMGWKDEDIDKVIHLPKSKLYFTAGNSMVIPVMEDVLRAVLGIF